MGELGKVLAKRLMKKGMAEFEVRPFVNDVGRTISAGLDADCRKVGRRLHLFGWKQFELDDHTLQLALAVLDDRKAFSTSLS